MIEISLSELITDMAFMFFLGVGLGLLFGFAVGRPRKKDTNTRS
jgi:hypothetical protein